MSSLAILGIAACAGVPVVGFITAPFARPVMTESIEFYLFLGERYTGGAVLIELAAAGITAALVVLNVTGGGAVGFHSVHLGQVVGADMAGSGSDHIAAVGAGLRCVFGCCGTGVMRFLGAVMFGVTGAFTPVAGRVALPFVCPVVTESIEFYLFLGERYTGGAVLIELAAGALVVLNVTGVSAVGKLFFHLGQMVGADMSAYIATDVAGII